MEASAFADWDFFLLVFSSLCLPLSIFAYLMIVDEISGWTIVLIGAALIGLSGFDVYLVHQLRVISALTPSLLDDEIFAGRFSILLYALPSLFACIGLNLIFRALLSKIGDAHINPVSAETHAPID